MTGNLSRLKLGFYVGTRWPVVV